MITKEDILSKVNSYDILNHYLQGYHNQSRLTSGFSFSNPFLAGKQKTPSFNIFVDVPTGEWLFKDFATDDKGSCFDLVMKLHSLTFSETLQKVAQDFGLPSGSIHPTVISQPPPSPIAPKEYAIDECEFSEEDKAYWSQYGITGKVLSQFGVCSLTTYTREKVKGKSHIISRRDNQPMFCYKNDGWAKIYQPLCDKKYRFQYLGYKEKDFVFGYRQLPQKDKLVIITGGEKDVLTLTGLGYNAIALNSETAQLDHQVAESLKKRFDNVVVLYDTDDTGKKQSILLADEHSFLVYHLPEVDGSKDISDFVKNKYDLTLLHEHLSKLPPKELDIDRCVYTAVELLEMGDVEQKYLLAPIFPQKGTAVLAGRPDTGKSQFARQMCIEVAIGSSKFIDFDLTLVHKRSIYVTTEDGLDATKFLISKQHKGLEKKANENLRFIFADTLEQEEIINELNKQLVLAPADLVVVDSYGDIFKGNDSNNNMMMRNTVKTFDAIAKKHKCLILFVHHINKGSYKSSPRQENIQGGSGLMQKVRLGIQLTDGDNGTRYFSVVKGNYCPKEYKQNSLILEFSEESFLFNNTGKLIPTDEIGSQENIGTRTDSFDATVEYAQQIFEEGVKSYGTFVRQFRELSGKSEATAKRAHKKLVDSNFIVECNGGYRLNSDDEDEDLPF